MNKTCPDGRPCASSGCHPTAPDCVRLKSSAPPTGSTAQVIEALKLAYRKHHLNDDSIGWSELSDIMCDALCEALGDDAFQRWIESR